MISYPHNKHMIENTAVDDSLFIYNDNVECYKDKSYKRGAGNAIIRPYNKYNPNLTRPHSAGIPTGTLALGGFTELNDKTKKIIDDTVNDLNELVQKHKIKKLYYSTDEVDESGIIGQALFKINDDVRTYITDKIKSLSNKPIIILNK